MIVLQTDHRNNIRITDHFAKGCNGTKVNVRDYIFNKNDTISSYGILRGTGKIFKKSNNFYYIDHGYFNQSQRNFDQNRTIINKLNGYFRVVYNDFWHNGEGSSSEDRLNKMKLTFKDINKSGEYIILSEPTDDAIAYYKLKDWVKNTIEEIKKHSDRKIILHNRASQVSLLDLLPRAWAFISDHSSAGFKAMQNGVPAYFTNQTLKKIGDIKNIEKHGINYSVFNNLAYGQWTIKEIESGECWQYLSNKL